MAKNRNLWPFEVGNPNRYVSTKGAIMGETKKERGGTIADFVR
jgi:hypothetical protein